MTETREKGWEYDDSSYWDTVHSSPEYYADEKAWTSGNDGEQDFVNKVLEATVGKAVLDVGCGNGIFSILIAKGAASVVGVDFSENAISIANTNAEQSDFPNVTFRLVRAENLPFADGSFDSVVSRRGPVSNSMRTLAEAHRVMKKGGQLFELTIGERDKENIVTIFGRGQMLGIAESISMKKRKMLEEGGFHGISVKDYVATEVFQNLKGLITRLKRAPIVPDFNEVKDRKYLRQISERCQTPRGIETTVHRVLIVATK